MKQKFYNGTIGLLIFSIISLSCATFQSKRVLDMAPFSETMTSLVGDIQFGIQGKNWVYLKPYLQTPKVNKVRNGIFKIGRLLRGIVFYSMQVVSLNSAQIPETKKCEELGAYLDEALRPSLAAQNEIEQYEISISLDTLDRIINDIKSQKTLIDGLGKAQPLIDAVIGYSDGTFNDLKTDVAIASHEVSLRIDSNFAPVRQSSFYIEELRTKSVRSYWLLYRYRFGDKTALDTLIQVDPAIKSIISADHTISPEQFTTLEKHIMQLIDNIATIKKQLDPEFELYKAHQNELDQISILVNEIMRKSRVAMIVFARSHRNLAAGITIPPEIDVMGEASKVVGKFIP